MGLERYGGSIGTVLSYFPNSRYDLYCGNGDDGVFRHVETNSVLPEKRFYLVALGRSSTQSSVSSPEGGLVGGMISLNR